MKTFIMAIGLTVALTLGVVAVNLPKEQPEDLYLDVNTINPDALMRRLQQRLGVFRLRIVEHLGRGAVFHHIALFHHHHLM